MPGAADIDVSVITPSLNMLGYLKRCVASVADQDGVGYEHIIMDGASTDGTAEWLAAQDCVTAHIGRDSGMYQAVNRGFRSARGRILAHLNCDEQYLPGTLAFVARFFDEHPEIDLLFGDTLTVRPDGRLVAYRKTVRPVTAVLSLPPLYVPTAATFFRRQIIEDGHVYDESFKDVADLAWIRCLVRSGYRLSHVRRYLAAFTLTGQNRSNTVPSIRKELERYLLGVPWWIKRFRGPWRAVGWTEKLLAGCYHERTPFSYALHLSDSMAARKIFVAEAASFRWRF